MNRFILASISVVMTAIGGAGELTLLRHLLVNSYPFKLFTYPPATFYERLGNAGSLVVLGVIVALACAVVRKAAWRMPVLLTVLAPLTYLALVVVATSAIYGWAVPAGSRNFDNYQIATATFEFARIAIGLAIGGFVIGGMCSSILRRMTGRKGDPATTIA